MILDFQTNVLTTVEMKEKNLCRIVTRYDDDLFSVETRLDVALPALDIKEAVIDVKRDDLGLVHDLSAPTGRLIGVRVGPGMTKIVRGVLGGEAGSDRLADLVLDAMEMLVNAMTVRELRKAMKSGGEPATIAEECPKINLNDILIGKTAVAAMGANPRLKDSCAAFRDL